ncbi:MAG: class I SAM-dependent methyltransferase [Lachnospiraceae bacterium]|nr:class I SAM-dependent methyltransferase [Lachnospiraceae bacterium]
MRAQDIAAIRDSELFDAKWYRETYNILLFQAQNYLRSGWLKGRDPSPLFHNEEYIALHPDVREAQINPLLHYELYGKKEGRPYRFDDQEALGVVLSDTIAHGRWPAELKRLCDKPGAQILEIGSRVVTGANFRSMFEHASYTGFDYYAGENVDVVGDAHRLTDFFSPESFDLIFCSSVLEHLAMPWVVAEQIVTLLKPGGYVFIETHYTYGSHERPWHFFQFSEEALKVLFPPQHGMTCIEAGVCNPMVARFADTASPYLKNLPIRDMFCHSEYLGQKTGPVTESGWSTLDVATVVNNTAYPRPDADPEQESTGMI